MSSPLISIIVPVYNVEPYLRQCVDSLLSQTYGSIEIILVDDGSTDASPAICDEYAEKFDNIKVVHKQNGGLSSARNAGLKVATGEYIGFVDSDDYVAPDMYSRMAAAFDDKGIGIVSAGFVLVKETNAISLSDIKLYEPQGNEMVRHEDYLSFFVDSISVLPLNNVCSKLYRRELIENIRFVEGRDNEDAYFTYHLTPELGRLKLNLLIIPDKLYYYRLRSGSISVSAKKPLYIDAIRNLGEIFAECADADKAVYEKLRRKYMWHLNSGLLQVMRDDYLYKTYFKAIQPYLQKAPLRDFMVDYSGLSKVKVAANVAMMKLCPNLYHKLSK